MNAAGVAVVAVVSFLLGLLAGLFIWFVAWRSMGSSGGGMSRQSGGPIRPGPGS